jgi:hypothetical protein
MDHPKADGAPEKPESISPDFDDLIDAEFSDPGASKGRASDDEVLQRYYYTPEELAKMSDEEKATILRQAADNGLLHGTEEDLTDKEFKPLDEEAAPGTREAPVEAKTPEDVAKAAAVASQDHTHAQGEANNEDEPKSAFTEPPPRRIGFGIGPWTAVFWGAVIDGIIYFGIHRRMTETHSVQTAMAGWENLSRCSYVGSFDGTKELSLSENGNATIYDSTANNKSIDGEWHFDKTTNLYTVTFNGESKSYSLLEPARGPICMLLKGDPKAADMPTSRRLMIAEKITATVAISLFWRCRDSSSVFP